MKSRGTFFSFLVMTSLILAACNVPNPLGGATTPVPEAATEIRVYAPNDELLRAMLKTMAQAAPGSAKVTLIFQDQTTYADIQVPMLASKGEPPDLIFSFPPFTSQLVDNGLLLDLRELINADKQFNLQAIYDQALEGERVTGNPGQYGLPLAMDNFELYYNKTLLQQAHIALPSADWTWEDLVLNCQNLQSALPNVACLTQQDASSANNWYPWLMGYGGNVLSSDGQTSLLNSAQTIEGFQTYADLWNKYKVVASTKPGESYVDCFINQRCAMLIEASRMSYTLARQAGDKFKWSTQVIPQHPAGRYTSGVVYGFGIAKVSKNADAAWAWLKSLLTPEAQKALLASGLGLPVVKDISTASDSHMKAYMQPFEEGRAFSVLLPSYPAVFQHCGDLASGRIGMAMYDASEAIFVNHKEIAGALAAADKIIQQCLDVAKTP
jgi:ABC-type glycerol-3-phosphate transport system substrate-binding protein